METWPNGNFGNLRFAEGKHVKASVVAPNPTISSAPGRAFKCNSYIFSLVVFRLRAVDSSKTRMRLMSVELGTDFIYHPDQGSEIGEGWKRK
jgi:hypothetical protein